ncbi:MAG: sigma 54-interacting transcriptional regulator [Sporomusaceae bacterium]|nr:sigma 54-interacting transcriptional regulator [Sporomusaceae bacterium]
MGKIVFIAPYEEIFVNGKRVIAELGMADKVECHLGWLKQGVEIARRAEAGGADVIVARGGTAELIENSGIQVPVIEIPITFQDLAESLLKAKQVTGLANPRIAVLAFKNMIRSIEVFARVMDINLLIYPMSAAEDIEVTVERALQEKVDVLLGGIHTTALAADRGAKTLLLASGEDSYRSAILQAEKVSYARTLEKERMEKFRGLVDYSVQGIVGIDSGRKITVFNKAAERLLNKRSQQAVGEPVEVVLPGLPVAACMKEARMALGELMTICGKRLMANITPIEAGQTVTGAMITFEDVGQIVEMEAAIRNEMYSKGLTAQYRFEDIRGESPQIVEAKRVARDYAGIDSTVLIIGASGTGKELFAQSIHNASGRSKRPFVVVNCGAIPASLLESELFGYAEGAFTGATKKGKPGLFELAHGGTIFLDEIGEMDKMAQTSLLRVIQERRVMRLGGNRYLPVDVRIITATHRNLARLIEEGKFREDLYYRINVLPLALPTVQERPGDAMLIAGEFLAKYNAQFGRQTELDESAKAAINAYGWPGNIRQLRNFTERLVVTAKDRVITGETVARMLGTLEPASVRLPVAQDGDDSERARLIRVLEEAGYNQKEAARRLGIDRSTLYRRLKAMNIEVGKNLQPALR